MSSNLNLQSMKIFIAVFDHRSVGAAATFKVWSWLAA
jgi:hypothetical protein